MTYQEALTYIESTEKFGIKPGLDAIRRLLQKLGNPEKSLRVIHIAGTNGKGSTASYIKSILKEAGYRVGFYTSPSLFALEERIQINDRHIDQSEFTNAVSAVRHAVSELVEAGHEPNTEFEIFTAMALLYFQSHAVDFVVLEVGLGGRLDATNVIEKPLLTVITPIALDHVNILGDTLEQVAYEKAGILKPGVPVVIHPQELEASEVIQKIAHDMDADLIVAPVDLVDIECVSLQGTTFTLGVKRIDIGMIGKHQAQNAVVAMTAVETLKREYDVHISPEAIMNGLKSTRWPCRLEVVRKGDTAIVLDGAHNPHGAQALSEALRSIIGGDKSPVILMGMLADKDVDEVLQIMLPYLKKVVVTEPVSERRLSADTLRTKLSDLGVTAKAEKDVKLALAQAWSLVDRDEILLVFGSFYLVGQIRQEVLCDQ